MDRLKELKKQREKIDAEINKIQLKEFEEQQKAENEIIEGFLKSPHYTGKVDWYGKKETIYVKVLSTNGESIVVRGDSVSVEALGLFLPKKYQKYIPPGRKPWEDWLVNDLHHIKKGDFETEFIRAINRIKEKKNS